MQRKETRRIILLYYNIRSHQILVAYGIAGDTAELLHVINERQHLHR